MRMPACASRSPLLGLTVSIPIASTSSFLGRKPHRAVTARDRGIQPLERVGGRPASGASLGSFARGRSATRSHCARGLPDFMVPKTIEFRSELPRTASGKVVRRLV